MDNILDEIALERAYQIERWGNEADDTLNTPNDWAAYICEYATRWHNDSFAPYDQDTVEGFRKNMIKVATLAVAAVESLDRQGKPFYQK